MAFQNVPIQGLVNQGTATSYYFEQYRDLRSIGVPLTGLTYVHSFTIKENGSLIYNTATFVLGNAQWGCRVNPSGSTRVWFEFWYNGSFVTDLAVDFGYDSPYCYITLFAGVDENTQKATIFLGTNYYSYGEYYNGAYDGSQHFTNTNYCYQWLQGHIAPQYNWQSVPSISGKNGILQNLVQIKDSAINSGEPVNNAPLTSFDSLGNINIPSVIDEQMPVDPSCLTSVNITYLIPVLEYGSYSYIKLAIKKNNIPLSLEDADRVIDLDEPATLTRIGSATMTGLDELSHYYFVIFIEDELGNTASSEPKDIYTSADEGWSFDYTGAIQTFVAPKTGVYQLETWGAQGGDATDEIRTARGGYGAYAVGEVFLVQDDTIYINVGGQNGYGGGGNYTPPSNE